ncbi:MAG: phosphate regulon transcriptional regulatory protein PhoB [Rhodospirillaceae bacterium]|nr:phosphate regulon transcriptional regulatory protein PhoB [Rhodospirillaceae bacterium]
MKKLALIVEDESSLLTLLRYNLESEGFEVIEAINGEEALILINERLPDIIILDWMLPNLSGIEVCRRVRRNDLARNVPIIMLTARSEENDRIRGLDYGADDYVVKPFSTNELLARIRAVLRRLRPAFSENTLKFSDIEMDLVAHRVMRNGVHIRLGPTEFRLLRHFMEHPKRVFTREQLLDQVWGHEVFIESRTVDVHIRRLRKSLNKAGEKDIIRTVRSAGYSMDNKK